MGKQSFFKRCFPNKMRFFANECSQVINFHESSEQRIRFHSGNARDHLRWIVCLVHVIQGTLKSLLSTRPKLENGKNGKKWNKNGIKKPWEFLLALFHSGPNRMDEVFLKLYMITLDFTFHPWNSKFSLNFWGEHSKYFGINYAETTQREGGK